MQRMWSNLPRPNLAPKRWTRWRVESGRREAARPSAMSYTHAPKRVFVDISILSRHDAGTGIQRLVKSTLEEILSHPPQGYVVQPVAATKSSFYQPVAWPGVTAAHNDIELGAEDVFYGLDLCANIMPHHRAKLIEWKRRGVTFIFVMYDLLPLQRPDWFSGKLAAAFRRWIPLVAILADEVKCISHAIADDFNNWIYDRYNLSSADITVSVMPIKASHWLPQLTQQSFKTDAIFSARGPFFLTVGTVEPRKGHAHLLDAFDLLWASEPNFSWVIVGQPGWKTSALQRRIKAHPLLGSHLFWLDRAGDDELSGLYKDCYGVISPSYAEGLGLPVLEALEMNKPILARNLPVYQELPRAEKIQLFALGATTAELANAVSTFGLYCRNLQTVSG